MLRKTNLIQNFLPVLFVSALTLLSLVLPCIKAYSSPYGSKDTRRISLDNEMVASITIHPGGTIISFPDKPTKVIIGKQNAFDIKYVHNDLAIAVLTPRSCSNLFVYLLGRRYAFELCSGKTTGDKIVIVMDEKETSGTNNE